jgi:hypothetical protein
MKLKIVLSGLLLIAATNLFAQQSFPFDKEVREYKHQDSLNFPKPDGILFIGASSIRFWTDLDQRFPDAPIVRRGLGGSELRQWDAYYLPYVVFPYHPRKIFLYAGENDIAAGRSAQQVFDDFVTFYKTVKEKLPDTKIYFLSMKYSPVRAKFSDVITEANQKIKDYIGSTSDAKYVDVTTVLYKPQTMQSDSSLFRPDFLHLTPKGYDKWQAALKPYVN